jgi:penicillin-binding protein 1A
MLLRDETGSILASMQEHPQPGRRQPIAFTTPSGNPPVQPPREQRPTSHKASMFILATLLVVAVGSCGLGGGGLWFLYRMYQTLPTFEQLHNIEPPQVSRVLATDSSVIHEFSTERRFWVPYERIPRQLPQAVISIEDRRFYTHWGIDLRRIFGAAVVNVLRNDVAQGGSTITQQLARNLYLSARQSLVRKIREALTATQLESYYTKDEILESYLNQVYLGAGVYGVQAAAQNYFSKDIDSLDMNECAVLAGMIQLPERYRPDRAENITRITARRNTVLRAMRIMGYLDSPAVDSLCKAPIPVNPLARTTVRAPYFIEMVRQEVAGKYGDDMLYNGGLTIYTTLDPVGQDSLERAAVRHIDSLQLSCNRIFLDSTKAHVKLRMPRDTFLAHFDSLYEVRRAQYDTLADSIKLRIAQVAAVALDVKTGGILALLGGRDFVESKFNRAVQARRQPGSAIKPFVYTTAIEQGLSPATIILDQPITLMTDRGEWRPENYDREFYGPVTMRYALAKSINLVAIQVLMQVGGDKVVDVARRMGLKHEMQPVPALAIGACQATPMEMTVAYAIYANGGVRMAPFAVKSVHDRNGRQLWQHTPESEEVLTPQTAFIMADMMKDVVLRGTGARIPGMGFTIPAGGKTGTTNDYSDAWFIGFTPHIACGVWVGVDERRSLGRITGSDGAIPIWVPAMKGLHRKRKLTQFAVPDSIMTCTICQESHKVATQYCTNLRQEFFVLGSFSDTCDIHAPGQIRRTDNLHQMFGGGSNRKTETKDTTRVRRPRMF